MTYLGTAQNVRLSVTFNLNVSCKQDKKRVNLTNWGKDSTKNLIGDLIPLHSIQKKSLPLVILQEWIELGWRKHCLWFPPLLQFQAKPSHHSLQLAGDLWCVVGIGNPHYRKTQMPNDFELVFINAHSVYNF